MKLLAVDPGSNSVGLFDGKTYTTLVAPKTQQRPERLAFIGRGFVDFLDKHGPYDFVVYEEQFVRGGPATRALYGAVGVIECSAINSGAGIMSVPQSSIRQWAAHTVGGWKGDTKGLMVAAAEKSGYSGAQTEHEWDAACLYAYTLAKGKFNA